MPEVLGTSAPPAPATPAEAHTTLLTKAKDAEWMKAVGLKGSPAWNEQRDLMAAEAGMTRAQWEQQAAGPARSWVNPGEPQSVSQGIVAPPSAREASPKFAGEPIRTQINPFDGPPPEQFDWRPIDAQYISEAPTSVESCPDISVQGLPQLTAAEQQETKTVAVTETLSLENEIEPFMGALTGWAKNGYERWLRDPEGVNSETVAALTREFGTAGFARQKELAEAGLRVLERYPLLKEQFFDRGAASSPVVIKMLAAFGARRASRK